MLDEAIACLREIDSDPAAALAKDLEPSRDAASDDLSGAASRVLELWDGRPSPSLRAGLAIDRLEDAGERLVTVSRLIVGR